MCIRKSNIEIGSERDMRERREREERRERVREGRERERE